MVYQQGKEERKKHEKNIVCKLLPYIYSFIEARVVMYIFLLRVLCDSVSTLNSYLMFVCSFASKSQQFLSLYVCSVW